GHLLRRLARDEGAKRSLPGLEKLIPTLTPKVEGDRLTVAVGEDSPVVVQGLATLAAQVRAAAGRNQSMNNLKQIALAFHNYLDVNKAFPASTSKDGKPLLSWRVHILPYLEQDGLYKQFKLDEPWDSEHNKALIAK